MRVSGGLAHRFPITTNSVMDEPRSNSRLRIAWKIALVAALHFAAMSSAAEGNGDDGRLRALLAGGWRADCDRASSQPAARIVRPAANLIDAIPPSVLAGHTFGSIEPGGAPAKPTLVDLIRQKSPIPQAKIVRPVATPLSVPLLAAISPLRVAEPIEWESIAGGDQGLPEPVTLEVVPQVSAAAIPPSPGMYQFEGMLLGDGLALDPH